MKMHHIGVIVKNIEEEVKIYENLGYEPLNSIVNDTIQNNRILFLKGVAGELLELIEPANENSSVYNLPHGLAHICYETDNLQNFTQEFKKRKMGIIFTKPITAPALNNKKIIFAYLKNKTIAEFVETGLTDE